MSNTRRPRNVHRRAGPTRRQPPALPVQHAPVARVSSPADVVTMIPYTLGFTPQDSLVLQVLDGPRRRFGACLRVDLVEADGAEALADYLRCLCRQHRFDHVIVVAYSDDPGRADPVASTVIDVLRSADVVVADAIRADGDRWWSYVCDDATCCDPGGTTYDPSASRVAAEAVLAGMQNAPSRESLRAQFDPAPPDHRAAVARLMTEPPAVATVAPLVTAALLRADQLGMAEVAALASSVQRVDGRDAAWALMTRARAGRHLGVWRTVMRQVPDEALAPVGSMAAFAAWLSGSGVLASHALDRVLAVHPTYSMATMIGELLERSVNPDSWTQFRGGLGRSGDTTPGGGGDLAG